ncbi:MAG: GNAT family N-acetyltransferase [Proteobacteria bacterium]|nr:GNAT family N-acetyltransferase [Pseudomonadota bacterium]
MNISTYLQDFVIREASAEDCGLILSFIKELAEYEKLSHEVVATAESLKETLFGNKAYAEMLIGEFGGAAVGYALFFHNFSTFTGRPGIYLEDIYVTPQMRGKGFGKYLLAYIAKLAVKRNCTRVEWSVLDWNEPAIQFYRSIGAIPMDGWTVQRLHEDALHEFASQFE